MPATSQTTAPVSAKEYEVIYILRPDIDTDGASRVSNRVGDVIGRESGVLVKVENWGRRKLAYPVRKFRRGVYVYFKFLGGGALVAEIERNLRMQKDAVLKFQTIKLRDDVELEAVKVDPEEVKFTGVEPMTEDERDESREKLLGLVVDYDHGRDDRRDRMADDVGYGPESEEGPTAGEEGGEES